MRAMSEVLLVRHCESSGQAPDAPLSERGYAQAEALARELAPLPIDRVISSPYRRARETIAVYARERGLAVHEDERLCERRLSAQPIPDWREFVCASFDDPDRRAPGGESGRETLARGWAALEAAFALDARLPVLVGHGQLFSLVLHAIDGRFGFAGWEGLTNPDVYVVRRDSGGALSYARRRAG